MNFNFNLKKLYMDYKLQIYLEYTCNINYQIAKLKKNH
jgi:hypothetical protein